MTCRENQERNPEINQLVLTDNDRTLSTTITEYTFFFNKIYKPLTIFIRKNHMTMVIHMSGGEKVYCCDTLTHRVV